MASTEVVNDDVSSKSAHYLPLANPHQCPNAQISKLVYVDDAGVEVCVGTGDTNETMVASAFADARKNIVSLRRKVAEFERACAAQQSKIDQYELSTVGMTTMFDTQHKTILELNELLVACTAKEKEAVVENARLRAQLAQLTEERANMVGDYKRKIECLIDKNRQRIVDWQDRFDKIEFEKERLAEENALLRSRIDAIKDDSGLMSSSSDVESDDDDLDPRTVLQAPCKVLVIGGQNSGKFNICASLLFDEIGKFDDLVVLSEKQSRRHAEPFTLKTVEQAVLTAESEYDRYGDRDHRTVFVLETKGGVSHSWRAFSNLIRRIEKIRATVIWSIDHAQLAFVTQDVKFAPDVVCLAGFCDSQADARDRLITVAYTTWFCHAEYESEAHFAADHSFHTTFQGSCLLAFKTWDDRRPFCTANRTHGRVPNDLYQAIEKRLARQTVDYT